MFVEARLVIRLALWCLLGAASVWGQGGPPGGRVFDLFADPVQQGVFFAVTSNGVFRTDNGGLSWGPSRVGLTTVSVSAITGVENRLYVATTVDGVFRSDDSGLNWKRMSDGLEVLDVRSLAVDPRNPDVLYAGTRNGGIFKTDNGGQGWIKVNNGLLIFTPTNGAPFFEGDYNAIAIDPNDSQILYTVQSSAVSPGNGILFRSTNAGGQWNPIASGAAGFSLKIDPEDPGTVYVGTNVGLTITRDSFTSTEPTPAELLGFTVTDIDVDPGNTDIVYVSTQFARTFRSDDRGATWTPVNAGMALGETFAVAVDPNTPATVFAGLNGTGVFRSLDMGMNWELASDGIFGTDIRALAVDPLNSANILAGAYGGGMFLSQNGGNRWEEARNGFADVQPRAITFNPQNPQILYAGTVNPFTQGQGALFRSTNGGREWETLIPGNAIFAIAVDSLNTQRFYVATFSGAFRTENGGQTFQSVNDIVGFGSGALQNWTITDLEIDPTNNSVLYALGNTFDFFSGELYQLFKTDDRGEEWQPYGPGVIPLVDITIDPINRRRLYLATSSGIFRNEDAAENDGFTQLTTGLPNSGNVSVTSIAVDGQDGAAVYAATSAGVYKSTNNGNAWTLADTGLETTLARVIRDDRNSGRTLYAGTISNGVFKTVDGGATWVPTRNPITLLPVISRKGLVGSADFDGAGVSGGEIVSFFAINLGPEEGVSAQFDPKTGHLPTTLAGVRVFFNNVAAGMFFVRSGQINCQVPFEVFGLDAVEVRVEVNGVVSNTITVNILDSHPGIYPLVANPDGTLNSADNRAPGNSFVSLYTTGQGRVLPPITSGAPAPVGDILHVPVLPVRVLNGEQELASASALAPNFVGLLQINVILGNLPPGEYELFIEIGGRRSRLGVTVYVS